MIIPFAAGPRPLPVACALARRRSAARSSRCTITTLGLTLSHYDARGHLVVARRIIDSITPGWQQIGAVWLPLPHLLNALPVQIDLFYRTGASAVAISIVAFAIATGAIASIVLDAHRVGRRRRRRRRAAFALEPERAVSAVHADDGAAAAGVDDAERGDADRVVRGSPRRLTLNSSDVSLRVLGVDSA